MMENRDKDRIDETSTEQTVVDKEMTAEELLKAYSSCQEQLIRLEESETTLKQQYQRLQADFDNFRKRTIKEREDMRQSAARSVIEELIPVMDNLDRALAAGKQKGDIDHFLQGMEMIYAQFWQTLQNHGLECIDCHEKEFNPELHQAVMQKEVKTGEDNMILEEVQKGYLLHGKLIRPSMVTVSKKC